MDSKKKETKEIDILAIAKKVLLHKILMACCLVVSAILGIVVALNTQKSYKSEVILAPELSSSMGLSGNLGDLASQFGIDLGDKTSMDAIYPEIYPTVMTSTGFILGLFNVPVQMKDSTSTKTYKEHLMHDRKVPFWNYPVNWIKEKMRKKETTGTKIKASAGSVSNITKLSRIDAGIVNSIRASVSCVVDKKTSVITITVEDTDPQVAAIIADTLQSRLQAYITEYKTRKSRKDVVYYQKLLNESKKEYDKIQNQYVAFCDANEDVVLESFQAKRDELENEMQLKFNAYSQLSTQLQAAKAKVQLNTPAFTILEQPTVAIQASSTPRSLIVIIFIILGMAVDFAVVIVKYRN